MLDRFFLVGPHHCFRLVGLSVGPSVRGHSNLVNFNGNTSKLHIYGLLPSTSRSSSNTGFVRHLITKMAHEMAATYQYSLSWSL